MSAQMSASLSAFAPYLHPIKLSSANTSFLKHLAEMCSGRRRDELMPPPSPTQVPVRSSSSRSPCFFLGTG